jgi:hypothetical protein
MKKYFNVQNGLVIGYSDLRGSNEQIEIDVPVELLKDLHLKSAFYSIVNNQLVFNDKLKSKDEIMIEKNKKIDLLKNKLYSTDYKITKCYEAFMRQLPLPYNLEELSVQRDAWRAEINQLEEELKQYEV